MAGDDWFPIRYPLELVDRGWFHVVREHPRPAPEAGICDAPHACVKINVKWVSHILGALSALYQPDSWSGDDDEQFRAIQEVYKLMSALAKPCECCGPSVSDQFLVQLQITNLFQTWNSTTTNTEINQYAPTLTFTSSAGEDGDRINARRLALCYACSLYVATYCETIKEINHGAVSVANLTALGLTVAEAILVAFAFVDAGTSLPLALALGAAAANLGGGVYGALTDAILDDVAAREELACCMYNTLKDLEPTRDNFKTAVDSCEGLSANAELIRATLSVDINNDTGLNNQFHAFINTLGAELRPAELGLIECDCVKLCYVWDFEASTGDWDILTANYTGSQGYTQVTTDVTKVSIEYNFPSPVDLSEITLFANHADVLVDIQTDAGDVILNNLRLAASDDIWSYPAALSVNTLTVTLRRSLPDGAAITLRSITIKYQGDTPTGGEVC